jgi:hypothetical protein
MTATSAAVGEFSTSTRAAWKLKAGVADWAADLAREPRYAGLDLPYEIRRCAEWWQAQPHPPKAPDRAIRNWLERSAERLRNGKATSRATASSEAGLAESREKSNPLPGAERSGERSKLTRIDGQDPDAEARRREQLEARRIAEWAKKHPEDAARIRAEIEDEVQRSFSGGPVGAGTLQKLVAARYRTKALERMAAPSAAA